MSHQKFLRPLCLFIAFLMSAALTQNVKAQTHTAKHVSITGNTGGYYEYLPQGYGSSSNTYPVIVFLHGLGELGDGSPNQLGRLLGFGLPQVIQSGRFPTSFNVNGQNHSFIVISPQFRNWPSSSDVDQVINYVIANYRVNINRIYLTGLSMGGGATWEYAGGNSTWASRLAGIVPVCGASWPEFSRARTIAAANLPVWATHFTGDPTVPAFYTEDYVKNINTAPAPNPNAKKSIWAGGSHDAWSQTYNPGYKEDNKNIYEWLLQFQKGGVMSTNQAPTANAGPDQTVDLLSTVYLSGSGADADGSIRSYSWTKESGPSQFSLSNSVISNPVLTNLVAGSYKFRLTVTDDKGFTAYDDVVINVPTGIPGKIEAEGYSAMFGIQTESTADAGGGLNIGYVDNGDWMDYTVNPLLSGAFTVSFRVATQNSNSQIQLKNSGGAVLATVNVPNTGGWQNWQTVSATVNLSAGAQTLRAAFVNSGANLNWIDFTSGSIITVPTLPTGSYKAVPSKVEAEAFTSQSGTQTETTSDAGGGQNIGYIDGGDWMEYNISPTVTGPYTMNFRIATANSGGQIQVRKADGSVLGTVSVPVTGGWQSWQTITATINLTAGNQAIRIYSGNGNWNINWIEFIQGGTATPPPPATTTSKVEAENYTSMQGVQKENTSDAGGGQNIGYIDGGDWMDYTVNPATTGTYTMNFRIATANAGGQIQVKKADGTTIGSVTVPVTGGWQTWQTISATVSLTAGSQALRIFSGSGNWNINWFELVAGGTIAGEGGPTGGTATTSKMEAESYTSMYGIQTENTSDAGGGKNVGYIDNGDWMDYSANVTAAGTYAVNFRISTPGSNAQLQLKSSTGAVLATVTLTNTGGYQSWQTVTANVSLPAGQQTLRVVSTGGSAWNFNWLELVPAGTATASAKAVAIEEVTATGSVNIFPNRVQDRFSLKVSNGFTGTMKVEIVNAKGEVKKQFTLNKAAAGTTQTYLTTGSLEAGEYDVKVQMNEWSQTSRLTKQ